METWEMPQLGHIIFIKFISCFYFFFIGYWHFDSLVISLDTSTCENGCFENKLKPLINNRIIKYTQEQFIELSKTLRKVSDVVIWSQLYGA